jgi:hypothetical protein
MPNSFDDALGSVVYNNKQCKGFSCFGMVHGGSSTFVDAGDGRDSCLDLRKAQAQASNLHELASAPFDPDVALFVPEAQISSS